MDTRLVQAHCSLGGILIAAVILASQAGSAPPDPGAPSASPVAGFASIDIGGRALRYKCMGRGTPTVIIEPGGGISMETLLSWNLPTDWPAIVPVLAQTTRVCMYDRAGLGRSDKTSAPRTSLDVARDLHALLKNAGIEPPYVLAGQSFGGMNVRMFNYLYPDQVAGVVLIDSSHSDLYPEIAKVLPARSRESEDYELVRGWREGPDLSHTREWIDLKVNARLVRESGGFGDRPLIVLTQSPGWNDPYAPDDIEPVIDEVHQRLQAQLVALSSRGK